MKERRLLAPLGVDVWKWFAGFEQRGGRVQDTEELQGASALRVRSLPWRASSQLILLLLLTAAVFLFALPWWIPVAAAILLIVIGAILTDYWGHLRNAEQELWRYQGKVAWLVLGLTMKATGLCIGLGAITLAAHLSVSWTSLGQLIQAGLLIFLGIAFFDNAHIPARAIEARLRARESAEFADATTGSSILYLRSFDDDTARIYAPLATIGWYAPLLPQRSRFEELVEAWTYGNASQVIAIGRPGEPRPSLGAARSYWTDDTWQEAVQRTVARCRAVVLVAGTSEGLGWEITQLKQMGVLGKTLLLLPPDTLENSQRRYELIASKTDRPYDTYLDSELGLQATPAITYTSNGELVHYLSFGRDWAAYSLALIHMLRTLAGSSEFEQSGNLTEIFSRVEEATAVNTERDVVSPGSPIEQDFRSPEQPVRTILQEAERVPTRARAALAMGQVRISTLIEQQRYEAALKKSLALQRTMENHGLVLCSAAAELFVAMAHSTLERDDLARAITERLIAQQLPNNTIPAGISASAIEVKDLAAELTLGFESTREEDAQRILEQQYEWRLAGGLREEAAETASELALKMLRTKSVDAARIWAERAYEEYEARGSLLGQAKTLVLLGRAAYDERNWDDAQEKATRAFALVEKHGFEDIYGDALYLLAVSSERHARRTEDAADRLRAVTLIKQSLEHGDANGFPGERGQHLVEVWMPHLRKLLGVEDPSIQAMLDNAIDRQLQYEIATPRI